MIEIKLKNLMDDYGINISDLYRLTGLSRATITPLVNKPTDVKAFNKETLDVLCEFFGVKIDDLLVFKPSKKKYNIVHRWAILNDDLVYLDMQKNLGTNNRHSILGIKCRVFGWATSDLTTPQTLIAEISPLSKQEIEHIGLNKFEGFPDEKELINADLFFNDFSKQPGSIREQTTKVILNNLLDDTFKSKFETVKFINSVWSPSPIYDKSNNFSFYIDDDWHLNPTEDNNNG